LRSKRRSWLPEWSAEQPRLLTAAAVIVGSFATLFDPIFQGLAMSLMAGEIASTLLSPMAVPVLNLVMPRRERNLERFAPHGRDQQGRPVPASHRPAETCEGES